MTFNELLAHEEPRDALQGLQIPGIEILGMEIPGMDIRGMEIQGYIPQDASHKAAPPAPT